MSEQTKTNNLSGGPTEIEISKFGPFLHHEHISRAIQLPSGYGKDRIVAMVRDPWWLFVYWEITPQRENTVKDEITNKGQQYDRLVLRVYDVTGINKFNVSKANSFFDITLTNMVRNWYIEGGLPSRSWCVEIGIITKEGNFCVLARSNVVHTPRFGMSDILDESWMLLEEEYWYLFGASGGFDVGKSSLEMKELFQKRLQEWISSGGIIGGVSSHILQHRK